LIDIGGTTPPLLTEDCETWGVDPDEEENWLARWAEEELPLFGVLGLRRVRGGSQSGMGSTLVRKDEKPTTVVMSQQVMFVSDNGASISVTSHRGDDDERFARIRSWAPINPYLSTQRGQVPAATWDGSVRGFSEDLEWSEITVGVDSRETPFEITELAVGMWVAVGRVPGTIISIDSRGVPLSAVKLQRLTDDRIPPPPRPELGDYGDPVLDALDRRFELIPFHRIRRSADYWALLDVEAEHLVKLAREQGLSGPDAKTLHQYWYERIEAHLAKTLERPHHSRRPAMRHSRLARRLGHGFLFQLWFNTFGPGARTWFGNRYVGIRRHTFRIRWRP
jgi:hypothetical protein